jgi:ferritin-like protein
MAAVFEQRAGRYKRTVHRDLEAMELEAAKEILAEVFRIELEEVEEMISSRLQDVQTEVRPEEGLWPQEFRVES